jgi:hypothetical protein
MPGAHDAGARNHATQGSLRRMDRGGRRRRKVLAPMACGGQAAFSSRRGTRPGTGTDGASTTEVFRRTRRCFVRRPRRSPRLHARGVQGRRHALPAFTASRLPSTTQSCARRGRLPARPARQGARFTRNALSEPTRDSLRVRARFQAIQRSLPSFYVAFSSVQCGRPAATARVMK